MCCLLSMCDRKSRYCGLVLLRNKKAEEVVRGFRFFFSKGKKDYQESNNIDQKETRYINPQHEPTDTKDLRNKPQEDMFVESEAIDELNRAIESLTETQQRRIRLFYFVGLSAAI